MNACRSVGEGSADHVAAPAWAELHRNAIAELRAALSSFPPECSARELSGPIASFARAAQSAQIPPELLLVALKDAIIRLPQFGDRGVERRAELLRDSVTLAIKEYYANPQP